jgi:hypothetical protein
MFGRSTESTATEGYAARLGVARELEGKAVQEDPVHWTRTMWESDPCRTSQLMRGRPAESRAREGAAAYGVGGLSSEWWKQAGMKKAARKTGAARRRGAVAKKA